MIYRLHPYEGRQSAPHPSALIAGALACALALPAYGDRLAPDVPAPRTAPLTVRPCIVGRGDPAECATLRVVENRTTGRGRTIDLHAVILRAEQARAREAIFMLAGGPGQASTELLPLAQGLAGIRATRDLVLLDQRGTGRSHPLHCHRIDPARPQQAFGAVFNRTLMASCLETLAADADLTQYTTAAAVADIEDVRRALGYDAVLLYGGSYGTRLAQAYMAAFPSRVRAAVLDGVMPMDDGPISYARHLQRAVDKVFEACGQNAGCHAAHPTLARDFERVLARFRAGPISARVGVGSGESADVQMTAGDFAYAIRGILYARQGRAELPRMIHEAARSGNVDEFAERYWRRARTLGAGIADGVHFSVLCAEDIAFASDAAITAATARTFMGRYLFDEYRAVCARWPRAAVSPSARQPVAARVPTLVLSGDFDPVTPPEFGERVARALPESVHIVSPDAAHGSSGGCARPALLHVLTRGTLAGLPRVCA